MPVFLKNKGEHFASDPRRSRVVRGEAIHAAESTKIFPTRSRRSILRRQRRARGLPEPPAPPAREYPANAYYQAFHDEASPAIPAPASERVAVYRLDMNDLAHVARPASSVLSPLVRGASLDEAS